MARAQQARRRSEPLVLPALPANVSPARRFVREWLAANAPDAGAEVVDDLVLAASELVTNAVEHGRGTEVEVVVSDDGEYSKLSVTSRADASGFAVVGDGQGWNVAEPASLTGRGLGIVRSLADDVDVRRTGDRLTITVGRRR